MLAGLAHVCYRSRCLVTASWVVALVVLAVLAGLSPGATSDDYTVPDSGSQQARQLLESHGLHDDQTGSLRVVFGDPDGLTGGRARATVTETLTEVRQRLPEAHVLGPFDRAATGQVSADGTVAYAEVRLADPDSETWSQDRVAAARDALDGLASTEHGMTVAFAGAMFETTGSGGGPGQGVGILIAAVILFLAFGSVMAMGLPLLVAMFGAGCGVTAVILTAHVIGMSAAAIPLAAMLAVGVGIDYSLFIVTRYRDGLREGMAPTDAVVEAQRTAGRSVLCAGATVVAAVLGLLTMHMPLINGVAVGSALAIAVTMAAALTLLPALLGFVGNHVDRFGLPHRHGRVTGEGTLARRWSRVVQRHPWPYAVGAVVLLAVLTAPALGMRLGFTNAGTLPPSHTARVAHDLLADGFGPGANSPLFAVIDSADDTVDDGTLTTLRDRVTDTPGVAAVSAPVRSSDREIAMLVITPTTGPGDPATTDLVHRLQDEALPSVADSVDRIQLTGATAAVVDFSDLTASRLPVFLAVIMVLALILLTVVFRSPVIALKAVIVDLLSLGAALGVLVAAVQWGWASGVFGLDQPLPVIAWVPMMMVAVVFGLSMDYEVFLLSRIKERHDHGERNAYAVAGGLGDTARVITAAAAIMICVFAGFILGHAIDLAVFGFGLAVAVLIDAALVRMVLVPAAMELLGEWNWWLPDRFFRSMPSRRIEAATTPHRTDGNSS